MAGPWVTLDGVDYTPYVTQGSVTHQHNRPTFSTIEMVSLYAPADDPLRCKVVLPSGELDFHGMIVTSEDTGKKDDATTSFTFADPTTIFEFRPCRDGLPSGDAGDFTNPTFVKGNRNKTAPQMLYEVLVQSMAIEQGADDAEGPMGIQLGTFKAGGVDMRGAPIDYPFSIADFISLLVETGELDVVCQPIDPGNGDMGLIHAFNGNYGRDLSGSIAFEYATGSHNAQEAKRVRDYKDLMNKLWVFLGPRVKTPADPGMLQHWRRNITMTQNDLGPDAGAVRARVMASRDRYYVRNLIRIFDGSGEEQPSLLYELYKRWFLMESWMRAAPATHVHVTPNTGIYPTFRTGDLIRVAAGPKLRGGFSGVQRVMEYTYKWEKQGDVELGAPVGQSGAPAVVTTADNEGGPSRHGPPEGSYE